MITNNIIKKTGVFFVGCAFVAALTACSDFLDILPMNDVVLENYWTEKKDVSSVLNSCYETLESEDALTRMGIWGELRSDNLAKGSNVSNEVLEILGENILPSNIYCNWSKIYECINRCNTVCHYAPMVQREDPNYTEEEMNATVAEASTLRALCYFYLIRTFRDVPYSTRPSIDDTQSFQLPATKFNDVLDSLITDLENVKMNAVRRYEIDQVSGSNYSFPVINSSRITRLAVNALLADLYLWKGDWDAVIRNCDEVIDYKINQFEELKTRVGEVKEIDYIQGIPMILESPTGSGDVCGSAYEKIFGDGNSFESIFELYFARNQKQTNTWVEKYYRHYNDNAGYLNPNVLMLGDVIKNTNKIFSRCDGRFWEDVQIAGNSMTIAKFARSSVSYTTKNATQESDLNLTSSRRGQANAPWIFYRLSDVVLMKAEALVERGDAGDWDEAFNLVNAVNMRATNLKEELKKEDYINSKNDMANLVMAERQREFMFEGKRWFDLVRRSMRDGNTIFLTSAVQNKYEENGTAIRIKLADMNIIFYPYAKNELKVNPKLVQNTAYNNTEDSQFQK